MATYVNSVSVTPQSISIYQLLYVVPTIRKVRISKFILAGNTGKQLYIFAVPFPETLTF